MATTQTIDCLLICRPVAVRCTHNTWMLLSLVVNVTRIKIEMKWQPFHGEMLFFIFSTAVKSLPINPHSGHCAFMWVTFRSILCKIYRWAIYNINAYLLSLNRNRCTHLISVDTDKIKDLIFGLLYWDYFQVLFCGTIWLWGSTKQQCLNYEVLAPKWCHARVRKSAHQPWRLKICIVDCKLC